MKEGNRVRLLRDDTETSLKAGDEGTVLRCFPDIGSFIVRFAALDRYVLNYEIEQIREE